MNLREFWAAEAAQLRDTSHLLTNLNVSDKTANFVEDKVFQSNIGKVAKQIHDKKVLFGGNQNRNKLRHFDTEYWSTSGNVKLQLNAKILPSAGIKSILDNRSQNWRLDCAQYVQVVYLGAYLLTDGAVKFDKYIYKLLNGDPFILTSHNTTGIQEKQLLVRNQATGPFEEDAIEPEGPQKIYDMSKAKKFPDEAALLKEAPIGSRVTVTNFYASILKESNNPYEKKLGNDILERGWGAENMIKVANNSYAAFGIGYGLPNQKGGLVNLETIKNSLVNEYYHPKKPNPKEIDAALKYIGVSQIQTFKR